MLNGLSCGTLLYLIFNLVRYIDLSWNTLEPSLVLMHEKLVNLGWFYYNEEIHISEPETAESQRHTQA